MCPCGNGSSYDSCCEPIHRHGAGLGTSAEQLMRARYCAYVRGDERFLLESWHEDTRPGAVTFNGGVVWDGLEVIATQSGGAFDNEGTVEFKARFRRNGAPLELHEVSSFVRVDGFWRYVDGR